MQYISAVLNLERTRQKKAILPLNKSVRVCLGRSPLLCLVQQQHIIIAIMPRTPYDACPINPSSIQPSKWNRPD
ncbi:hypothetical protein VTL71DRAFT_11735 [Oculimacula yallundae]|uniref:Uncharacterized protein n=1 Tax=Oculimacula yallundae TaxID=86028 RepID=A0ABR4CS35_9HELO